MPPGPRTELEAVTDAVFAASRVLVAVASRSIAAVDEAVTLPQFRALVVLTRGSLKVSALAKQLDIQPSTATRLCDRLVRRRFVTRRVDEANRREVILSLSPAGRALVRNATMRRRRQIASIMTRVPERHCSMIIEALTAFCHAAGEDAEVCLVPW